MTDTYKNSQKKHTGKTIKEYSEYFSNCNVKNTEENPCKLGNKIFREIEKLNRNKPILLIGKNKKIIQEAISWIHLTHAKVHRHVGYTLSLFARYADWEGYHPVKDSVDRGEIILTEYSCVGKTETEIEHDLFNSPPDSLITNYTMGEMLFVRGLNSKRMLERLVDSHRGHSLGIEGTPGVMIINVQSKDIVPQELLGEFEVIELEPGEAGRITVQGNAVRKKQKDKLFYTWNKDKIVLFPKDESITVKLTKRETELFDFLRTDSRRTIEEIAGEIWKVYRDADIKSKTNNIGELRRRINEKCEKLVPEGIISELDSDSYYLTEEIEESFLSNSKLRK